MKRILSSIGIGNATVDTVLPRTDLVPGETVTATVDLTGGDAAQEIENVYFRLKTRFADDGGKERSIIEYSVDNSITLEPDERQTFQVDIPVPLWTPLTKGGVSVWLETGLDIDWATGPTDADRIEVVPGEYTTALFEAVGELGFALRYSELVETPYLDDRPFGQEFDFYPPNDRFATGLDELEITVMPRENDLRVFVEFDQVDPVAEEYDEDFDEQEVPITFDRADAGTIRRRLKKEIERYSSS